MLANGCGKSTFKQFMHLRIRVAGELIVGFFFKHQAEDLPGLTATLVLQQGLAAQVLRQVILRLKSTKEMSEDK